MVLKRDELGTIGLVSDGTRMWWEAQGQEIGLR